MLNSYLSSLLKDQPQDIMLYTRDFFSNACKAVPLVLVGPSGAGKSTLLQFMMAKYPGVFEFSISTTTRNPRAGEQDGVHYYFVTREEFERRIEEGYFLEYAEVHGNFYGTSKKAVLDIVERGKICVLDIDVQGTLQVYRSGVDFNCMFITPPDLQILEQRLTARGTEDSQRLQIRLRNAQTEIDTANSHPEIFRDCVINGDLSKTQEDFLSHIYRYYPHLKPNETI